MKGVRLSEAQVRALEFLAIAPWISAWWGGKPHGGWPKEMNARTYNKLIADGLVGWVEQGNFRRKIMVTPAGRSASLMKGK